MAPPAHYSPDLSNIHGKDSTGFDYGKYEQDMAQDWSSYGVYVSETSVAVRLAFIRKVYGVLCAQLLVTTLFIAAGTLSSGYKGFLLRNSWLITASSLASFVLLGAVYWKKDDHPTNLYLLAGWTLSLAVLASASVVFVPPTIVLQAGVLTFAITFGLTLYAFRSKKDFSSWGAALSTGLWLLICVGLLRIFFPFGPASHLVVSACGALLFMGFILYDTQSIIRKHSVDDWIPAVINLYLDILNLFLEIMRILSVLSSRD